MPIDRRAAFQLGLLMLAVPAQYLLTKYMATSETSRNTALQSIMSSAVSIRNKYLSWQYWQKWCMALLSDLQAKAGDAPMAETDGGESPAMEVLRFREQNGHFGTSADPRSPRPPSVKYRIGQVVKHKRWGYRGVIVGWDAFTRAPESWLKQNHPADKKHWRRLPSYSVLVDTRDRPEAQTTYVAQENIQVVIDTKVMHPELDDFFEVYDGAQYIARPWLKTIYPHD